MKKFNVSLPLLFGCVVLALGILAINIQVPLGVARGVPYVLVVLVSAWFPDRRFIFLAATLCTLMTFVGFELSPEGGEPWKVATNRGLAVFGVWVTAFFVYQRKGIEGALQGLNDELEDRTHQLKGANEQLSNFIDWEKSTKEKIQEKEFLYRTLFTQFPDAIVVIDPETTLPMEFNDVAPRLLGYTAEEFKNLRVADYEAQESREEIRAHVEKVIRQGEDSFETKLRTKQGEIRDFFIDIRVIELRGKTLFHNMFKDITERKRRESHLKFFKHVIAQTHDPIYWISPQEGFRFVYVNEAACRHYGYSEEELLEMSIPDWDPNFSLAACESFWQELKTHQSNTIETLHRRRNGEVVSVEVTGNYVVHEGKEFIAGTIKNITERKQNEEVLRKSEARLNEAQRIAHVGSWELDLVENQLIWSKEVYRIFEIDSTKFEASYEAFLDMVHPDDRSLVDKAYTESLQTKKPYEVIHRIQINDGRIKYVHEHCETYYDDMGNPIRSTGTVQDITEGKEAEDAIQKLHRQNQLILHSAGEGIYGLDIYGNTTFVNPAAAKMLRYLPDELLGMPMHAIVHHSKSDGSPYPHEECLINQAINDGKVHTVAKEVFWRKDGTSFPVQFTATPIKYEEGNVIGAVVTFSDITERQQAEKGLQESEERLRQISDTIEDVFWIRDWETQRTLFVSKAYERVWGRTCQEVYADGRNWAHAILSEDRKGAWENFVSRGEGETYDEVYRIMRPDGSIRWIRDRGFPIQDVHGNVYRVAGIAQDITERREAEDALKRTERMYHQILDAIPDLVFVKHSDSRLVWANKAFCDYYGMPIQQVEGLIDSSINKPEYTQQYLEADACVFQTGKMVHIPEEPITRHDREVRFFQTVKAPIWDEHENVVMLVGVARDMTERKNAEKILQAQAHIIDQIHDAVVSTDLDGVITSWNKGAESQYGYTAEEVMGKSISLIYPEDQHEFLFQNIVQPLKAKGNHEVEAIVCRRSGERITVHLSLDMLKDEKGTPTGVIGYSLDITERKRIEETLRKFERIMNCSKDLLAFVDRTMVFLAVNKQYEESFNIPQEDLMGKHVSEIRGKTQFETVWKPVLQRGFSGENVTFEHWVNFPNDRRWYMETHIDPFFEKDGQISGVVVQCRNITERHEMEALKAQYLNKVLSAQEDERARIARELHDETGQSLTALLIGLRTLDAMESSHEMKERINYLRSLTSNTIEEVQRLAMGLRPLVLDDFGLQVALERYCREYAKLYHVRVDSKIKIVDSDRLPREIETALFRIFQEAFTNIAKHAMAKRIHVHVQSDDQFIRMVIEDDGRGFPMKNSGTKTGLKSHLGLHGMRQRAMMIKGDLTVVSTPGKGTTITVAIPIRTVTLT